MRKILYMFAAAALLFVSCKKETAEEAVAETATDTTAVATDSTATAGTSTGIQPVQPNAMGTNPNTIMNQGSGTTTMTQTVTPQMLNQQTAQPVKVAKGMNPSHGQPGHRCDIPVGAPLNSPPGKTPATTPTNANAVVTPNSTNTVTAPLTTTAPPVVTAEGMNPPHGQDGHRCDIAVGAPLPKT